MNVTPGRLRGCSGKLFSAAGYSRELRPGWGTAVQAGGGRESRRAVRQPGNSRAGRGGRETALRAGWQSENRSADCAAAGKLRGWQGAGRETAGRAVGARKTAVRTGWQPENRRQEGADGNQPGMKAAAGEQPDRTEPVAGGPGTEDRVSPSPGGSALQKVLS